MLASAAGASGCGTKVSLGQYVGAAFFDPGTVDFGPVGIGTASVAHVRLRTDMVPLTISNVAMPAGAPFTIVSPKASLQGLQIDPGPGIELRLQFLPTADGTASSTLQVGTGGTMAQLPLSGTGARFSLSVSPNNIDFGTVQGGTKASRPIVFTNNGGSATTIDKATLNSSGQSLGAATVYQIDAALPLTIPANGQVKANLIFDPQANGPAPDKVLFDVAGSSTGLPVTVTGIGNVVLGGIFCNPSSVDFGSVQRGQSVSKQVSCGASSGAVQVTSVSVSNTSPYFSVGSNVPGPTLASAASPLQIDVRYTPDGQIMTHTGALVVGYTGASGPAQLTVPLTGAETLPPPTTQAISVELTWDKNLADLDVHLVQPGARFYTVPGDVFWNDLAPSWGPDMSYTAYLDRDNTIGYGPEDINVGRALPGTYTVYAHYYQDHGGGPSNATVKVYIAGQLAGTFSQQVSCDGLWQVGTVQWNGTGGTFQSSGALSTGAPLMPPNEAALYRCM